MSVSDKIEIREIFAEYALAADGQHPEKWSQLFTEDGIFEMEAGAGGGRMQFHGRPALTAFMSAHNRYVPGTRHIHADHITRVSGDDAIDHCTFDGLLTRPDKVHVFASGWYETRLRKEGGKWKIVHRIAHMDNFAPDMFVDSELAGIFEGLNNWVSEHGTPAEGPSEAGVEWENLIRG